MIFEQVVGENMKALEVAEEKSFAREEKFKEQVDIQANLGFQLLTPRFSYFWTGWKLRMREQSTGRWTSRNSTRG